MANSAKGLKEEFVSPRKFFPLIPVTQLLPASHALDNYKCGAKTKQRWRSALERKGKFSFHQKILSLPKVRPGWYVLESSLLNFTHSQQNSKQQHKVIVELEVISMSEKINAAVGLLRSRWRNFSCPHIICGIKLNCWSFLNRALLIYRDQG